MIDPKIAEQFAPGRDEDQVIGHLTPKQSPIVEEYLVDLNGKQAAIPT